MINIYEVFEKPMIKILAFMEIEGIKIDYNFYNFHIIVTSVYYYTNFQKWKIQMILIGLYIYKNKLNV